MHTMASKADKGKQGQSKEKSSNGPTKMTFDSEPLKIDKWDGNAVKHALDDTAKKIMKEEYGYVEDFRLVDMRLFISTVGVAFALFALAYDYVFPFPASKLTLAVCAVSYFITMSIHYLYSMYIEKNTFMLAREKDSAGLGADNVWRLQSTLPRFSHMYTIAVHYTNGKTKEMHSDELEKSIASWFDTEGGLVIEKYFADIQALVTDISKKKQQ